MSNSTNAPETVELSLTGARALDVFVAAKEAEKIAIETRKEAEKFLRTEIGDALAATVNGVVALKVVTSQNSHVDKAELQRLAPEILAQTLVVTPYNYLKVL